MATATGTQEVEGRARTALVRSPLFRLRALRVEQRGEQLLISGRVESFYQKQVAQEVVRSVAPEVQVVNAVEVD